MQLSLDFTSLENPHTERQRPRSRRIRPGSQCDIGLTSIARRLAASVDVDVTKRRVSIWWNPRLQTTAGTADHRRIRIDLNPKLVELGDNVVDRILRHELAHLVAFERAAGQPIAPHGVEWKKACADLGIAGERASHSLPLQPRKLKVRYAYRCPNCEEVVQRVRKMAPYSACYSCCREYNGGEYHPDFVFQRVSLKAPETQ